MTAAPSITGWRAQVQRLAPLELPLLPCGAGIEFKAPMNLRTGRPMVKWQEASFTAAQIIATPPRVRSVGTRTGKGFIAFDFDGATAVALGVEQRCDPHQAQTWRVERDTDQNRLKTAFSLTPQQQLQLGAAAPKAITRWPNRGADGQPIDGDRGENLQVFHHPGKQVVVLGEHVSSGGNYLWPDGHGPEALAPIPSEWWELALAIVRGELSIPDPLQREPAAPAATPAPARSAPSAAPRDNYPPRTIEQVMDALNCYPVIAPKTGQREAFMALAWGLREAVREAGGTDELALELIEAHSPGVVDAAEYLKTEPHTIGSSKFFGDAYKLYGWRTRDELAPRRRVAERSSAEDEDDGEHLGDEAPAMALAKPKRHTLAPDEVMAQLPQRLGQPRLNIRTNEFHCGSNTYSADDVGRLYLRLSGEAERWPKDTTADALVELAKHHAFDPVEEELNRIGSTVEPLPMEMWQRLDLHLLGIDDPIAASFLPQFLISAVARVFRPGCGVRRSPVLIGAQQRGKTELGRILFGADHWIEGVTKFEKDDLMRLQTAWGVELAELNGLTRRCDQEQLKSFLTAKWDDFRAPYGKGVAKYHRRCVFWGTSNGPPLRDLSGSTRFVCIPIPDRMLPLDWAIEHRAAIWSRAVEQFRQIEPGQEPWDRVSEEDRAALQERNANHKEIDPWADEVAKHLQAATDRPVSAAYVLDRMDIPKSQRNNPMAARVRQLAEAIGWVMERRSVAGERRMGFWPPEPASQPPAEDAAAIALPHLPQRCHSAATPADASQGNGSAPAAIPAIPISSKLEKKEEGSTPPAPTPAAAAARGEVFGSFGVAGVAAPADASHGAASDPVSAMAGGMAGGVAAVWQEPPGPELLPWLAQISQLRSKHPTDAPHTLALKLFAKHGLRTTGRAIRDLEAWIAAQPVEEF